MSALRRAVVQRAFDSGIVAKARGRRHVVVLGDSHTEVFRGWQPHGFWFQVAMVPAATASGIRNPNSTTEALPTFRARLAQVRRHQDVLVVLGEVDCGYVIWRRARRGSPVEDELERTLAAYAAFLGEVRAAHPRRVLVLSVPLPTLPDDATGWGEVAQKRSDVTASQAERTALTDAFNRRLAELCAAEGHRFVDATSGQRDPATGLVREDLLRRGEADHHLAHAGFRALLEPALRTSV